MIHDVRELEAGAVLHAQVGVVGSGLAGLDLARNLGRNGIQVVVLESGRREFDPQIQSLTRVESIGKPLRIPDPDGDFTPYLPPIFRGETRVRQFGGTSTIWTGKWHEFPPTALEERPWIPYSGWPLQYEVLRWYYKEVARDYGFADFDTFADSEPFVRLRSKIAAGELEPCFFFWEGETTRPATRFQRAMEQSQNVRIVLGANATEILLNDDLNRVEAIAFQSLDRRCFTLRVRHLVLAAGGLEVPRLLLASHRQCANGIGNSRDLVGRFFMDHPKTQRGRLLPGRTSSGIPGRAAILPRPRFQVSFALSNNVQQRHSLLNHVVWLRAFYTYQFGFPSERVAAIKAARQAGQRGGLMLHALRLSTSPVGAWKTLQKKIWRDRGGPIAFCRATLSLEQAPNPASRVLLGHERDSLGMQRLIVDWRLTSLDRESSEMTLHYLRQSFARAEIGNLDFGPEPLTLDEMTDGAHHMGTTRMATTPELGVVDPECTVFGIPNLHVASSSVFPTGHSFGPTLTIVALARRLGDHIRRKLEPQAPQSLRQQEPAGFA
jgi:choline dehydrogenase-like flavoprotein